MGTSAERQVGLRAGRLAAETIAIQVEWVQRCPGEGLASLAGRGVQGEGGPKEEWGILFDEEAVHTVRINSD